MRGAGAGPIGAGPCLRLQAVASRHPEKVHRDDPAVRVVATPAALLEDPAVELVVVAAPNALHHQLAEREDRLLSVFQNRRWDVGERPGALADDYFHVVLGLPGATGDPARRLAGTGPLALARKAGHPAGVVPVVLPGDGGCDPGGGPGAGRGRGGQGHGPDARARDAEQPGGPRGRGPLIPYGGLAVKCVPGLA